MGKPFVMKTQQPAITDIGRERNGRFVKLQAESAQAIGEAMEKGELLNDVLREQRVPDRLVGAGAPKNVAVPGQPSAPVYPDSLPWPKATTGKVPFKIKGGA